MIGVQLLSQDLYLARNIKLALSDEELKLLPDCKTMQSLIESFKKEKPDIVLLDAFIAGISVIEVIKKLKKADEKLVLLVLSRIKSQSFVDKAFRFGASDIIPIPFSAEFLKHTILHRCETVKDAQMVHFNANN